MHDYALYSILVVDTIAISDVKLPPNYLHQKITYIYLLSVSVTTTKKHIYIIASINAILTFIRHEV